MKLLTAAEMREVDRRTIELGITGPVLMENAGHRVVEFLAERFSPLGNQRVVVLCGKGANGGDGLVVARQLFTRFRPAALWVVLTDPEEVTEPLRMLRACGFDNIAAEVTAEMQTATVVVDAVLGTGITGAPRGRALEFIRALNERFPASKVVAVDIPSGLPSDGEAPAGEWVRADATVTFTAMKVSHGVPPNCDRMGEIRVGDIGSPCDLYADAKLHLAEPADFRSLLAPRAPDANKGRFGHVLVVGGAEGKTGAAEMTGIAALRSGAGLVTVACSDLRLRYPELMTSPLPHDTAALRSALVKKDVVALGPGLGTAAESGELVEQVLRECSEALVIDADGLNNLPTGWRHRARHCIVTPHPGEMARLTGRTITQVQADRVESARAYAVQNGCTVVLKGHRSVIAFADGRVWINPTGSPALATGGTGDILTGFVAGLLAQFPDRPESAVVGAVYLHGRAGDLGAQAVGEQPLIATDLLTYLPEAIRECSRF